MRIGIITINTRTNYGGILQAFAMTQILKNLGHDARVVYLPVHWNLSWHKALRLWPKRLVKKMFGSKERIFKEHYLNKTFETVSKNTQRFIDEHTPCLYVDRYTDLKEYDWEALIVGSDQIWRPAYNKYVYDTFLKFAISWNIKRVAYAASFGTDEWEYTAKQTKICSHLAKMFDYISVREQSGIELCEKYLGVKAEHVLDPTLLLDRSVYEEIVINARLPHSPGTLLNYILDETSEKQSVIDNVSHKYKLKPFRVNSKFENLDASAEERIQPSVEQWLKGFMDAEFVVTDSFHACVFSIIFNKPFIVVGNKDRGMSRFESLLSIFGLEDRLVSCFDTATFNAIDWTDINNKLKELKIKSISKLTTTLQNDR